MTIIYIERVKLVRGRYRKYIKESEMFPVAKIYTLKKKSLRASVIKQLDSRKFI